MELMRDKAEQIKETVYADWPVLLGLIGYCNLTIFFDIKGFNFRKII